MPQSGSELGLCGCSARLSATLRVGRSDSDWSAAYGLFTDLGKLQVKFQEGIDADTDMSVPTDSYGGQRVCPWHARRCPGPRSQACASVCGAPRLLSSCQGRHSWALTAAQVVSSMSEMCPGPLGPPYTSAVLIVCAPATPHPQRVLATNRDLGLSSTGRASDCTRLSLQRPPGCSRFMGVWPCPGTPARLYSP